MKPPFHYRVNTLDDFETFSYVDIDFLLQFTMRPIVVVFTTLVTLKILIDWLIDWQIAWLVSVSKRPCFKDLDCII